MRKEGGPGLCPHRLPLLPFGGWARPSSRPAGVGQALAEHWQGRAWQSGGSGSCNAVSAGEPGEGPLTGFWEWVQVCPLRPWAYAGMGCHDWVWAWRRRGEPRWGLAWPDEAQLWQGGAVFHAVVPLVFECGNYILTLFFFFFCILCLRKWSNKSWSISKNRIQFSRKVKESNFFWVALSSSDGFPRWIGFIGLGIPNRIAERRWQMFKSSVGKSGGEYTQEQFKWISWCFLVISQQIYFALWLL